MAAKSIAIVGPTASGKTRRAVEIAEYFGGEIISADSRQVYRGMSIGTGKDIEEYKDIPYHLIDIADAGEKYNLHLFLKDFNRAYADIIQRQKLPVICGGSGMYVENALAGVSLPEVPENPDLRSRLSNLSLVQLTSILEKYKTLHNTTDVDTPKRAIRAIEIQEYYLSHPEECRNITAKDSKPLDCLVIGIDIDRDARRRRITQRLHDRLEQGMLDEVKSLLDSGIKPDDLIYYGLEYKFLTLHLIGQLPYQRMVEELEIAIHQFAKRQMTWFRGMEHKRGIKINWIPYDLSEDDFLEQVAILYGIRC